MHSMRSVVAGLVVPAAVEIDLSHTTLVSSREGIQIQRLLPLGYGLFEPSQAHPELAQLVVGKGYLPEEIVRDMRAPDGRARVQVLPAHDLLAEENFRAFVEEVQDVAPDASGIAVNIVAFANATRDAFFVALSAAVAMIVLLLFALWRSPTPIFLALMPLLLSSVLIAASMVLLGIPYNFMNVIVIPLLMGIGIDSGIHLVHRAYHPGAGDKDLLATTTARAVFYSAMTTTVSFGALSLSSHRGMASLGIMLSIGMLLTLFANLVVLPALIVSWLPAIRRRNSRLDR